ncbi:MAG: hypothetical protein AAF430_13850 [Myxococcota bacterium]
MPRVFSDTELREAGLRSVDGLKEALAASDASRASAMAKRLRREVLAMQANYQGWEVGLLDQLEERGGAAAREVVSARLDALHPRPADEPEDLVNAWRETARALRDAIEAGDAAEASRLGEQLHSEGLARHDRGMARVLRLLSELGTRFGDDAVEAALAVVMRSDMLGDAGFRERAEALMHFTRVHLQPFALEEDDEKLTFRCPVCPSGGRLLNEGHYDGPDAGYTVRGPRPLTWGRDALPVYCCHEPAMEQSSIEMSGSPLFVVEPATHLGQEPCLTYLYKNPADVPERYYTRLGLRKPKPDSG